MRGAARHAVWLLIVLLVGLVAFTAGRPSDCDPAAGGDGGSLSAAGREQIPAEAARMYEAMAKRWRIDVAFLASIGAQECNHGRCPDLNQVNGSGCVGWMQLGVGGRCGTFWNRNRCDGNHDGRMDVLDPWDNICAAAKGLRRDKGAPATGGTEAAYRAAAGRYYGACTGNGVAYCDQVMARAKRYGLRPGQKTTVLAGIATAPTAGTCPEQSRTVSAALTSGPGKPFTVLGTANRPGAGLTDELTAVLRQVAGRLPRRLIVCTGTNHSQRTTTGNVSDHWSGNAVDLCSSANGFPATGGGYGDTIAAAALMVAGKPQDEALRLARQGGAFTLTHAGLRFQIIWKSLVGGNHFNHVHVGISRVAGVVA